MRTRWHIHWLWAPLLAMCLQSAPLLSQDVPALQIANAPLDKGYVGQRYEWRLIAQGGVSPWKWRVASGALPKDVSLNADGMLAGVPRESGDFHFVATVADSAIPAHEISKDFTLRILAPLLVQWGRYPKVNGLRIDGSVKISNQTDDDFDLTLVAVAVNDIGRATAVGYQRFTLKKGTLEMEIPFGETLPTGGYQVNVDVVGEVAAKNVIRRARLATADKLTIEQGP